MDERDWSRTGGHAWANAESGESVTWDCGYCGGGVTSDRGWHAGLPGGSTKIRICPRCNAPTFFSFEGETHPPPRSQPEQPGRTACSSTARPRRP